MTTISKARTEAGMTQVQAAKIIGKTQSHYSKIERGTVEMSARDALKLCKAFAVQLSHLLTTD